VRIFAGRGDREAESSPTERAEKQSRRFFTSVLV
jgi:hypothetical protein